MYLVPFLNNCMQNRLQFVLGNRRFFRFGVVALSSLAVLCVSLTYDVASAQSLIINEDMSGAGYTSAETFATGSSAVLRQVLRLTLTGSDLQNFSSVSLRLGREALSFNASCQIAVDIYFTAGVPGTLTGAVFLARTNYVQVNNLSISNAGRGGAFVNFSYTGATLTLTPGLTFFFEPTAGTTCNHQTFFYSGDKTSGQIQVDQRAFLGTWNADTGRASGLRLYAVNAGPAFPAVNFELLSNGPYFENELLTFRVTYSDIAYTPAFVNFFANSGAVVSTQYPFFSQTNSGSFTFQYAFQQPSPEGSPYYPFITLTDFSTGSTLVEHATGIEVLSRTNPISGPLSQSTFNVDRTSLISGESAHFTWNLAGAWCADSSVSSTRLFRGFPQYQQSFENGGTVVDFGSSSGSLVYVALDVPYYPYIRVTCSDGSIEPNLYLGSSTNPIGIVVQTQAEAEQTENALTLGNPLWFNGGGQADYWTGSGGYKLFSNKSTFARYETVPLKWSWNGSKPGFSIGSVYVYPDPVKLPGLAYQDTATGALESGIDHFKGIVYNAVGQYQPAVELRSTTYNAGNPATYERFYIGGGLTPLPQYVISITNTVLSQQSGSGAVTCSTRGVFGLSPQGFSLNLNKSDNMLVQSAQEIGGRGVSAMLWLGGNLLCLVDNAPLLSTVHELIVPAPGVRQLPNSWNGHEFKTPWKESTFTVEYADSANHDLVWSWLIVAIDFIFILDMIDHLWPHKRKPNHPR